MTVGEIHIKEGGVRRAALRGSETYNRARDASFSTRKVTHSRPILTFSPIAFTMTAFLYCEHFILIKSSQPKYRPHRALGQWSRQQVVLCTHFSHHNRPHTRSACSPETSSGSQYRKQGAGDVLRFLQSCYIRAVEHDAEHRGSHSPPGLESGLHCIHVCNPGQAIHLLGASTSKHMPSN